MKALNVYQINLIQTLKCMRKTKYGINPRIFLPKFREVDHQYPTRFSQNSFYYKRSACKTDRIDVSEGTDVNKKVHQKGVIFVTIGISYIIVLSFNQMSAIDVMFY